MAHVMPLRGSCTVPVREGRVRAGAAEIMDPIIGDEADSSGARVGCAGALLLFVMFAYIIRGH
jgi:hypothetical protein